MFLKRSNTLFVILATLLLLVPVFSFIQFTNAATPSVNDEYVWVNSNTINNKSLSVVFTDKNTKDGTNAAGTNQTDRPDCRLSDAIDVVDRGLFGGLIGGGNVSFGDVKGSVGEDVTAILDYGEKPNSGTTTATLYVLEVGEANGPDKPFCKFSNRGEVTLGNASATSLTATYTYSDTYNIVATGTDERKFTLIAKTDPLYSGIAKSDNIPTSSIVYAAPGSEQCRSFIVLDRGSGQTPTINPASGTLYNYTQSQSGACNPGLLTKGSSVLVYKTPTKILIQNSSAFNVENAEKPDPAAIAQETEVTQNGTGSCSDALSPFGWILCPILSFASSAYDFFVTWVNQVLFFDSSNLDNNGVGDLRNVVGVFIRIANVLLVLFALVMIAGQIFNFEIFSAYTLKKMLPRIFIGAIAIQFSWIIFTLLIQVVNAIGTGIYGLLLVPFGYNLSDGYITILEVFENATSNSGTGNGDNVAGLIFGSIGIAGAAAAITIGGAWLSIIVAALGVLISLLVAIVTLIVRQVIIIVLLAIAPLAIALWIFPGTSRFWEMWWKSFSRLLMMYPLIMLLFAAGTMGAHILLSSGSGIVTEVSAIIAFFAPIFMISMTYKFAGAAFGSIASFSNKANSRLKGSGMFGLRSRSKEQRDNSIWSRNQKMREHQRQRNRTESVANFMSPDNEEGLTRRQRLNRRFSRTGLNHHSQLASQASAVGDLEKIQNEERQAELALLRRQIDHGGENGVALDRINAARVLTEAANADPGSIRSSAAIEFMTSRRMNGELAGVNQAALVAAARSNTGIESYIWQNNRHLADGYEALNNDGVSAIASGMTSADLQGQSGAFWTAIVNPPQRNINDNPEYTQAQIDEYNQAQIERANLTYASLDLGQIQALYNSEAFGSLPNDAKQVIQLRLNDAGIDFDERGGAVVTREAAANAAQQNNGGNNP
jgi:hypothetical protein